MQQGSVSEIAYRRFVEKKITEKTEGIISGVEAAPVKLEGITVVMSSNCMLKWFEGCEDFLLQKTMNGIYEKGGIPESVQLEINIPEAYEQKRLGKIVKRLNDAAVRKNIPICQCRVYAGCVESPLVHMTLLGSTHYDLSPKRIKPDMDVVMAGTIAVGGTAVLSEIYQNRLSEKFPPAFVRDCLKLKAYTDMREAAFTAADNGAVAMHSVSGSGVFGAVWELASSAGMGITVRIPDIPVWQETIEVAELFDANPYLLDGTGAMLIVSEDGKKIAALLKDKGIYAEVIGKMTEGKDRIAVNGDEIRYLEPPRDNELYKFIS